MIAAEAAAYHTSGWHPLALRPNDKRPIRQGWQTATLADTLAAIEANPGANIGLAVPDGIMVLDVDIKNDGPATLAALETEYGVLPATLSATTATGGRHLWFALPSGVSVGNRVGIAPGLDVRSQGGYVVAPPSTINGKPYAWDSPLAAIAPAPDWLLDLASRPATPPRKLATGGEQAIPEGMRNRALFEAAAAMRGKGFSIEAIVAALTITNAERCDPPLDDGEVANIAKSAGQYRPGAQPWEVFAGNTIAPMAMSPAAIRAPRVSVSDLFTSPSAPQRFLIEGIMPGGVVTLLGAHGGTGKSMLALIAAVCLATGKPFMGMQVEQCRVVFFSGEDPAPVVRRRLSRICRHMGIHPHEFSSNLLMLDATENPVLYNGSETRAFAALRLDVEEFKPGAIIIDNASDTFDSNEIERARVREFIRLLAALGNADNAAVLLLAHIDKQTARGGNNANSEGYSGSTAWHNSARSRLFLSARDEGLMLEHQKSNFGLRCDPVFIRWTGDGLLERADTPGGVDDRATILRLIGELYGKGVYVSPASNSANNAFKVLQPLPEYPRGLSRHGLAAVIQALLMEGAITMESYSTGQRNTRQRYALSALSVRQVELNAPDEQHTRPVAVCVLGGVGDTQRNETALDIAGGMQHGS